MHCFSFNGFGEIRFHVFAAGDFVCPPRAIPTIIIACSMDSVAYELPIAFWLFQDYSRSDFECCTFIREHDNQIPAKMYSHDLLTYNYIHAVTFTKLIQQCLCD